MNSLTLSSKGINPLLLLVWCPQSRPSPGSTVQGWAVLPAEDMCEPCAQDSAALSWSHRITEWFELEGTS